jgi:hypothetical protein
MTVLLARSFPTTPQRTAFEDAVADRLRRAGARVVLLPHLYHVAERDALWDALAALDGPLCLLVWLHPRPAEWVLRRHGLGEAGLRTLDLGAFDGPEACVAACGGPASSDGSVEELTAEVSERWHPVLDYSRCVGCQQCLQFCLFGVYELDGNGGVRATEPDRCKPGCPACARICPRGAIMFPLHEGDAAIAGAPGTVMKPDAAARAMFEKRTAQAHRAAGEDDDLDALINDLDRLTGGGPA